MNQMPNIVVLVKRVPDPNVLSCKSMFFLSRYKRALVYVRHENRPSIQIRPKPKPHTALGACPPWATAGNEALSFVTPNAAPPVAETARTGVVNYG